MVLNLKNFIRNVLIGEVKEIQQTNGHHYLSFGLIAQGIESLGACLDNKEFHYSGRSGKRFRRAIRELFPDCYHKFNDPNSDYDLYSNLRCGLLHVFFPGNKIELIQQSEVEAFGNHLDIKVIRNSHERLILVSQDLFSDFEIACQAVIDKIDNNQISQSKIQGYILETDP